MRNNSLSSLGDIQQLGYDTGMRTRMQVNYYSQTPRKNLGNQRIARLGLLQMKQLLLLRKKVSLQSMMKLMPNQRNEKQRLKIKLNLRR
jgi:hypothetical protein